MMLAHEQSTTAVATAPTFGNRRAVSAGKLNFMLFPWCQVNWNASNDVWIFGSPDSFCWQAASYLIVLDLFNRDGVKTCYSGTPAVCTGATTDLPLPAAACSAPHRLQGAGREFVPVFPPHRPQPVSRSWSALSRFRTEGPPVSRRRPE